MLCGEVEKLLNTLRHWALVLEAAFSSSAVWSIKCTSLSHLCFFRVQRSRLYFVKNVDNVCSWGSGFMLAQGMKGNIIHIMLPGENHTQDLIQCVRGTGLVG